jgi:hypothetical protein
MGPVLTALFWGQASVNKEKQQANVLLKLLFLLLGMCLINPSGINGFLAVFHIHKAYSFPIIENCSIFYLLKLHILPLRPILLYCLASIVMLVTALLLLVRREGFKKYVLIGSLTLIISLAALRAARMIGIFGFFWMPLSTYVYSRWLQTGTVKSRKNFEIILVILGIIVSASVNCDWGQNRSLGIVPGCNKAAEFFKANKLPGKIFNNYDIGGYLIFHLSPRYKLFVDDRMEAFPEDFLTKTYVPMQIRNGLWRQMDQRYHFNVIFLSLDLTPLSFTFMKDRFADPSWALVYIDNDAIIFLKRNAQNAGLVRRFEIHGTQDLK